jgi:hypothetical protein
LYLRAIDRLKAPAPYGLGLRVLRERCYAVSTADFAATTYPQIVQNAQRFG